MAFGIEREQLRRVTARGTSALQAPNPEAPHSGVRLRGISTEVVVLFLICTLDMLSSAWLFHHGLAVEGNPLLRGFAEAGMLPFVGAKLATFLPALVVAEWYRRVRPRRALPLLRCTIAGYVGVYTLAVAGQFVR
jgi:hypothetical protein